LCWLHLTSKKYGRFVWPDECALVNSKWLLPAPCFVTRMPPAAAPMVPRGSTTTAPVKSMPEPASEGECERALSS
jgi:hypothetical protein